MTSAILALTLAAASVSQAPQLELLLSVEKATYRLTEDFELRVCIKNISSNNVTIPAAIEFGLDVRPFFPDGRPTRTDLGPRMLPPPATSRDEFLSLRPGYLLCLEWPPDLEFWKVEMPGRYVWRAAYLMEHQPDLVKEMFGIDLWKGRLRKEVEITLTAD